MSIPPTVVTSRRRQHELLRTWPHWALTSILLDPTEVARVSKAGWSGTHHLNREAGERIAGTPDGLGFGLDESWHNPREVVAWPDIEAIAHAVPGEVREQLVQLRERLREHTKTYPRFAASADAVGCGPIIEGQPLTPRQEAYVRELEAFEASGVLPAWEQKQAALEAERLALHERALGAGGDREPVDLLDLLEDQQLDLPAAATSPVSAEQTEAQPEPTTEVQEATMKPAALTGYTEAAGRPEPGEFTYCPVVAGDGTVGHVWITCAETTQVGEDGQDVPCAQFTVLDDTGISETLLSEPYRQYREALRIPIGRQERFDTYQRVALAAARRLGDRRISEQRSQSRSERTSGVSDEASSTVELAEGIGKGKPRWINGVLVARVGTYGRRRLPEFRIGGLEGPSQRVLGARLVPDAIVRHQAEWAEYEQLDELGREVYDLARWRGVATSHEQTLRLATDPPADLRAAAERDLEEKRQARAAVEGTGEGTRAIGEGRERISVAELRRNLPVGTRVQVFYLAGQREQTEPDVRTVTKQTAYEMISTPVDGDRGAHLAWSGTRAERDAAGILIVRHADGTPVVAYKPLPDDDPAPTEATLPIDPALAVRYSEARKSTDPAVLEEIAKSEIALNRRVVAENATTSSTTLQRLAADEDVTVRRQVARNPHTPAEALDRLADDPDEAKELTETKVRWYVASNPTTSESTLTRMATASEETDLMVLAAIGRHPHAATAVLEHLATAPAPGRSWVDPDVRQAVASNPSTPPAILAAWENADANTGAAVAKNPATPTDVLERLSRDTSTSNRTRALVATNPSLPAAALFRLAHEDTDAWVREHAARNPNIDRADSHRVAGDVEPKVRSALAGNRHVDPDVLTRLQTDPDWTVRVALAKNPSITPATLHALLGDANPRVKQASEQNTAAAERAAANSGPDRRPALRPPTPGPRSAAELYQQPAPVRTGVAR